MSTSEKREIAVQKYFIKTPDEPTYQDTTAFMVFTIGGLIAALAGMANFRDNWWLLCIAAPVVWSAGSAWFTRHNENNTKRSNYDEAYKKAEPKPSDQQMDKWRDTDLDRIRKSALAKLDLVPNQVLGNPADPIMVVGPSEGARLAIGKDNFLRFSGYEVVIVYLTDYHLAAYSCIFDMGTGLETKESTQEYHYKDVVSVATQADNSRLFKIVVDGEDKPLADYQKFSLSVASGERIEVVIAFPQLGDIIKNARLAPTGAENAVKTIRAMLREKKGGVQLVHE
jgi:hypothetical protein